MSEDRIERQTADPTKERPTVRTKISTMLSLALVFLLAAPVSSAQEPHDDPSVKGTTGLFVIPRASTLQPGTFSINGFYLVVPREEGDSNVQTTGIAGGFALGVHERIEIFGSFEPHVGVERDPERLPLGTVTAQPRINEHPFAQAGWQDGIGDLRLGVKAKVVGEPLDYDGIAVAAEVKLPTADDEAGIGTGEFDFTPMVIGSYEAEETVGINGFAGFALKGSPDQFEVSNEFLWGAGVHAPTRFWLQAVFEVFGTVFTDEDDTVAIPEARFLNQIGPDYTVLQAGVRFTHETGLALNVGGNLNLGFELDTVGQETRWGYHGMISYSRSRPEQVVFEGTSPMPLPPVNRPPTLSCRAERTTLRQGESVRLFADVSDPDNDEITVSWDTQAGTISPRQGTQVTWSSEGVQPGSGPIVAVADDGYGGTAECELRMTVEAPPPPAQPIVREFQCTDFASGSTRIDNRCKAILDDVALQLRQNPRATAVITGYSDSTGSADVNQRTSQERADNGRDYLVETHGISAGRIQTAGAGSSDPIADNSTAEGRSRNRRIEIVVTIPPQ